MISEELKQQLQHMQIEPPAAAWDKISALLDEEVYAQFPQQLSSLNIQPPATAWQKIEEQLEPSLENLAAKLYDLEIPAPPAAWQSISTALNQQENGAVIKTLHRPKLNSFIKYAAAACLLVAVAFGIYKITGSKTDEPTAISTPQQLSKNTGNVITPNKEQPVSTEQPSNNLPAETKIYASVKRRTEKNDLASNTSAGYMTQTPDNYSSEENLASFQQASLHGNVPGSHSILQNLDRYIIFTNPDGYIVRISKKLAEALGCVYNNATSEQTRLCQDQIKKWSEKLSQLPVSASPDNFLNVVDMLKSAQQNDQL